MNDKRHPMMDRLPNGNAGSVVCPDRSPGRRGGVNLLVVAAAALLIAATPLGIVVWRGRTAAALVAYEVLSVLTVVVLVFMTEGVGRVAQFEVPAALALLLFGGGLAFARAFERQP